jgi:hypothetical protein
VLPAKVITMSDSRRSGPAIGTRYKGRRIDYDPASGKSYRTGVYLEPEHAVRVLSMAERAGMSVSGFLASLAANVQVDPATGLPPFLSPANNDGALPFEEAS